MDICDELQKNMESSQLDGFINGRNLFEDIYSIIHKVLEDPDFKRKNENNTELNRKLLIALINVCNKKEPFTDIKRKMI